MAAALDEQANAATGDDDNNLMRASMAQGKLYDAYNELHGLAQQFDTPFDAPAVLVVGHQTDGKSALVEALMGFQFNHVGGGTKTRRPITLHMRYDHDSLSPRCRLVSDTDPALSLPLSLPDIQVLLFLLSLFFIFLDVPSFFLRSLGAFVMFDVDKLNILDRRTLKLRT